jgi:hypothetical protein
MEEAPSISRVLRLALDAYMPAVKPAGPPPMITISYTLSGIVALSKDYHPIHLLYNAKSVAPQFFVISDYAIYPLLSFSI